MNEESRPELTAEDKKYVNTASILTTVFIFINTLMVVYVINYKPKVGAVHLWLVTGLLTLSLALGIACWVAYFKHLRRIKPYKGRYLAAMLVMTFLCALQVFICWPYPKDIANGPSTVTTTEYRISLDGCITFENSEGLTRSLPLPKDKLARLQDLEDTDPAREYIKENSLFTHTSPVTLTYYPASHVIVKVETA